MSGNIVQENVILTTCEKIKKDGGVFVGLISET